MNITVFNFKKRLNSTARPTDDGSTFEVECIDPTNFLNPKIIFSDLHSNWNYAYIQEWGRYYFMSDAVSIGANLWQFQLTVDVLATYKTEIGNTTAFVERSESKGQATLPNYSVLPLGQGSVKINSVSMSDLYDFEDGTYVINTCNAKDGSSGLYGGALRSISELGYETLLRKLYNADSFGDAISDEVVKTFFNPFQYILSSMWFPIKKEKMPEKTGASTMLGWWDSTVTSFPLSESGVSALESIDFPEVPTPEWCHYSKAYTRYFLYIPSIGWTELERAYFQSAKVYVDIATDFATGNCVAEVRSGVVPVLSLSGQMGVPLKISQVGSSLSGVTSIIGGALGALTGNIGGAISNTISGAQQALAPPLNSNGSVGNRFCMQHFNKLRIVALYREPTDSNTSSTVGYSYYADIKLNSLSGFIKCADAHCAIAGSESERQQIDSYLNGGFYYE